jgi:hypothetical protein
MQAKAQSKQKMKVARPAFVCIPRQLTTLPPIRHRSELADAALSVSEFAVAASCMALARKELSMERHDHALRAGKKAIDEKREKPIAHLDVWSAREQFDLAGGEAYLRAHFEFGRTRSEKEVRIECTRSTLLKLAGLSRNERNARKLPNALRRLMQPAGGFPPLILSGGTTNASGKLDLRINGRWIPSRRFARVPWPAPTKGPTLLALYLFLFGADLRGQTSISTEVLYRRLGIPLSKPAHAQRALDRALDLVNKHLRQLNKDGKLDEFKFPTAFKIAPIEDGSRLRFQAAERPKRLPVMVLTCGNVPRHGPASERLRGQRRG